MVGQNEEIGELVGSHRFIIRIDASGRRPAVAGHALPSGVMKPGLPEDHRNVPAAELPADLVRLDGGRDDEQIEARLDRLVIEVIVIHDLQGGGQSTGRVNRTRCPGEQKAGEMVRRRLITRIEVCVADDKGDSRESFGHRHGGGAGNAVVRGGELRSPDTDGRYDAVGIDGGDARIARRIGRTDGRIGDVPHAGQTVRAGNVRLLRVADLHTGAGQVDGRLGNRKHLDRRGAVQAAAVIRRAQRGDPDSVDGYFKQLGKGASREVQRRRAHRRNGVVAARNGHRDILKRPARPGQRYCGRYGRIQFGGIDGIRTDGHGVNHTGLRLTDDREVVDGPPPVVAGVKQPEGQHHAARPSRVVQIQADVLVLRVILEVRAVGVGKPQQDQDRRSAVVRNRNAGGLVVVAVKLVPPARIEAEDHRVLRDSVQ